MNTCLLKFSLYEVTPSIVRASEGVRSPIILKTIEQTFRYTFVVCRSILSMEIFVLGIRICGKKMPSLRSPSQLYLAGIPNPLLEDDLTDLSGPGGFCQSSVSYGHRTGE